MMNRGSAEASVSEQFAADHARLDVIFDDACQCVGAADFAGARDAFAEFANGLGHHIAVEERFLFPAFDASVAMPGPTMVMRREHRTIEQLIALAGAALAADDASGFATEAAELAATLRAHNLKEERVLYPRTDAALGAGERAELVAVLQRG